MRIIYPLLPVLLLSSGVALLIAGEADKSEKKLFRMRPTHEQLQAQQATDRAQRAERQVDPKAVNPVVKEKREGPDTGSLIKRSAVLSSGRSWTIVPKGAVLHVPAQYEKYVNGKRAGQLVPWQTFYAQNRGWLHVHPVSMDQARGEKTMDPKQVEAYMGLSRVVVSVCHGGPISVIAPKKEEAGEVGEVPVSSPAEVKGAK
jgi:aromatic ring-cleaving dioxygenase